MQIQRQIKDKSLSYQKSNKEPENQRLYACSVVINEENKFIADSGANKYFFRDKDILY